MAAPKRGNGIGVESKRGTPGEIGPAGAQGVPGLPGVPVDVFGGPTIDPTKNVLDLVEAERRRQDGIRDEVGKRYDTEIRHLERTAIMRADHAKEIRTLEAERLDKIRQIDVVAVNTAADRAAAAIQALAVTAAANAENLRNALNATAATIASQLSQTVQGINERLAALEKANYEGQGRQAVSDPAISEMLNEVKNLRLVASDTGGRRQGQITAQALISWALGIIVSLIAIGSVVVSIAVAVLK